MFKTPLFIGYGSQGRAQALRLKKAGFMPMVVLPEDSQSRTVAKADGLRLTTVAEGVCQADLVMMLTPDEGQGEIYQEIEPHLSKGGHLGFGHGYAVEYGLITPREDLNVFLVAPKVAGAQLRESRESSWPVVVAVHQDPSGACWEVAEHYAALVAGADQIIRSTFREETVTNLFSEQGVLLGGMIELMKAGFETLVEHGYSPEVAYYECVDKIQIIGDLIHKHGIEEALARVSKTAEFGARLEGGHAVSRSGLEGILQRIESGAFSKSLQDEKSAEGNRHNEFRKKSAGSLLERTGKKLRSFEECVKRKDKIH